MSLTSIMRNGLSKEVMKLIPIPKKEFQPSKDCIACPRTKNYALIGTAFDYLLRSEIKRRNKLAIEGPFIADAGIQLVAKLITLNGSFKAKNKEADGADLGALVKVSKEFHFERDKFLKTGALTDEFIEKTIRFARIDTIYRALYFDDVKKPVDEGDIEDMRALYNLIPDDFVKMGKNILLDPDFGQTSRIVGGADVDLIIDGALIDIKTTKEKKLDEYLWSQIVGYAILAEESLNTESNIPRINTLGIYFSRYGDVWNIDSKYVYSSLGYNKLKTALLSFNDNA